MAKLSDELKWSAQNGDLENLKLACDKPDFDINGTDSNGRQLIHCAADYGQKEILDYLISSKKANVNAVDKHGNTPLLNAVFEGHTLCVKFLLDKNADKSMKGPGDVTAYEAAESDDIKNLLK